MGSYATTTTFYSGILPRLTSTVMATTTVSTFIDNAEAYVNSFISSLYSVPITGAPPVLVDITQDLTCYNILRAIYGSEAEVMNQWTLQYLEPAKEKLQMILDKKMQIVSTTGSVVNYKSDRIRTTTDYGPTFEMDSVENWVVNDSRLDDVEELRE